MPAWQPLSHTASDLLLGRWASKFAFVDQHSWLVMTEPTRLRTSEPCSEYEALFPAATWLTPSSSVRHCKLARQ